MAIAVQQDHPSFDVPEQRPAAHDRAPALLLRLTAAARQTRRSRMLKGLAITPGPGSVLELGARLYRSARTSRLIARLDRAEYDIIPVLEYRARMLAGVDGAAAAAPPLQASKRRTAPLGRAWLAVLAVLLAAYAIVNFALPALKLPPSLDFYLLRPLVWLGLAALVIYVWRRSRTEKPLYDPSASLAGLMMGGVQVACLVIMGLLFSFGESPYSHRLLPMLGNLFQVLALLLGMEIARSFMVTVFGRRSDTLAVVLTALVFTLAAIPAGQLTGVSGIQSFVKVLGEEILPTLAENMLASFLSLTGGPLAAFAYRGVLMGFEWFSPILPNLKWIVMALVGTLIPVLGLVSIQELYAPQPPAHHPQTGKKEGSAFGWFNTGALGYQPTVLSGPSMRPTIWAGDIVVTKEVPLDQLAVGDVIRFYDFEGPRFVIHRVIEIDEHEGDYTIITQGDNVNAPDDPITGEQVVGKVVAILPKIGYVSVWFREGLTWFTDTTGVEINLRGSESINTGDQIEYPSADPEQP